MVIGGNKGYGSSKKVFNVDECMNSLILHSKLNVGRVGHAAILVNNKDVLAIGGYNANSNEWLASVECCVDAFDPDVPNKSWKFMCEMNEARYYFGCCTWNGDYVFVFGGMNDKFMESVPGEGANKCLNSIERYTVEFDRWDKIDLKTYQKFSFISHLVAIHVPWDKDRILILGGQTYNRKSQQFENVGVVFKFDPIDEKLIACKNLDTPDRFLTGQGICDNSKHVAALGEHSLHIFNGETWATHKK